MSLKIDFLTRKNVYLKQEAAIARIALELACAKCGLSSDDLIKIAVDQQEKLIVEMQKLQKEANTNAEMVIGCKEDLLSSLHFRV